MKIQTWYSLRKQMRTIIHRVEVEAHQQLRFGIQIESILINRKLDSNTKSIILQVGIQIELENQIIIK